MMRTLLVRGLLAGLVAGALVFVFAFFFGEPSINAAIALEEAAAHTHSTGEVAEPEVVSRGVQSTIGLATGLLIYAVAFGGLFAVAFGFAYGRIGALSVRATAAALAAAGFVAAFLVPFLKYPGNPPAVGSPDTINDRTLLYWVMLVASVLLAAGAVYLGRALTARLGAWSSGAVALAAYVVAVGILAAVLPVISEVPDGFPAAVVWEFRTSTVGIQLLLWTTIGLLFGALAHKPLTEAAREPALAAA
jgi:MFS family permease